MRRLIEVLERRINQLEEEAERDAYQEGLKLHADILDDGCSISRRE